MQLIQPSRPVARPPLVPLIGGTALGTVLIVGGIFLAYIAIATPALQAILPTGRPDPLKAAGAVIVWAIALVAPAGFLFMGANRLVRILGSLRGRMPRRSTVIRALADRPDLTVASGISLPDGRAIADLVLGPFGAAIIRELPPAGVTRVREGRWELRLRRGWITIENPLERAVRDAERVRRWLAHDDADFIVKVYAAVVGPEPIVGRTTDCAVLTPDQIAPWIDGLPPQRSLTEGRRDRLVGFVRDATA
jgi:hypothetical protein